MAKQNLSDIIEQAIFLGNDMAKVTGKHPLEHINDSLEGLEDLGVTPYKKNPINMGYWAEKRRRKQNRS